MKDKKEIFDVKPSAAHVEKVKTAVEDLLAQKRQEERRNWFQWLLVPAFASAAGFVIWKKNSQPNEGFLAAQEILEEVDDVNELELVADLEILEDFETLEEWDGFEEA